MESRYILSEDACWRWLHDYRRWCVYKPELDKWGGMNPRTHMVEWVEELDFLTKLMMCGIFINEYYVVDELDKVMSELGPSMGDYYLVPINEYTGLPVHRAAVRLGMVIDEKGD